MKNNKSEETLLIERQINADNRKVWKSVIVAFLLCIWESFILYFYVEGILFLFLYLLLHLIAVAFSVLFVYYSNKRQEDLRFPLILLLAVFSTGPLGAGGFLVFTGLFLIYWCFTTPFAKWFEDLFPEGPLIFGNIFERIKSGWDDYTKVIDVVPFMDVFSYGSLLQKQGVLDAIVKDYKPEYAAILKRALEDPNNEIRIQAAAIVAKLNADFEDRLQSLLKKEAPDRLIIILKLAQHFDMHAFTGILDRRLEKENQQKALHYYREYLKKRPDDRNVWFAIGRILFRLGEFSSVISWFEEYGQKFKDANGNATAWYLEALYMLKQYEDLSESAKEALEEIQKGTLPQSVKETVESWSNSGKF